MAEQHETRVEQDPTLTSIAASNALEAVGSYLNLVSAGHMVEGGMTVALSTAANCLPEGHELFWFTVSKVAVASEAAEEQIDEALQQATAEPQDEQTAA